MPTPAVILLAVSSFVIDVGTTASYSLHLPLESVLGFTDDLGLFERHMPGVVGVEFLENGSILYRTSRSVPLSGSLDIDFTIGKTTVGDSVTVYESTDPDDPNYMMCSVALRSESDTITRVDLTLRIRLIRESGWSIHWMAPLLGERFIGSKMKGDLDLMVQEFIRGSSRELEERLGVRPAQHRTPGR